MMDAMETDSPHDIYDTIKSRCLAKLLEKLTTKLPGAGETEMRMLADLWEQEVDEEEALDATQANHIDTQLQRSVKQLLKYLDGKNPKPPHGWQTLASAAQAAQGAQRGAQGAQDTQDAQPSAPTLLPPGVRDVEQFRSAEPVWALPKASDGTPLYPQPPPSHTQSHRRLNGVLSGMRKGSQEQTIAAHVYMHMHYGVHKQSTIFSETIPAEGGEHAGGPFPVARETHRAAPADPLKHTEVIVDGEMQKAKSPETADQAWTYTFIEGVASIIYVRVRGGGEVGSRDMKSAIDGDAGINGEVKRALAAVLPHYGYQTGETAPEAHTAKFNELFRALRLLPKAS